MKLNNNIIMLKQNISLYVKYTILSPNISVIIKINSNLQRVHKTFFKTISVHNYIMISINTLVSNLVHIK